MTASDQFSGLQNKTEDKKVMPYFEVGYLCMYVFIFPNSSNTPTLQSVKQVL